MMLNSYRPKIARRFAIMSIFNLVAATSFAYAGDSSSGNLAINTAAGVYGSSLGLAFLAAFLAVTVLGALSVRQSRLSRQLSSEREKAASLCHAAYHDSLTGLRNRHALSEDVAKQIGKSDGAMLRTAVLLFDLDRFKFINDTMGHAAGDAVLTELAQRITKVCGSTHQVYRLGGDEFVVLWTDAPDDAAIGQFCAGLAATVFQPVEFGGHSLDTAGSIGIAVTDSDVNTLPDLLKRADLALYHAKETPGCSYSFFDLDIDSGFRLRRDLETDMREGLTADAFEVEYLAVFKGGDLQPRGISAQLKWNHPDYGTLAPKLLLPMAENTGLIVMVGKWMLRQALIDAAFWPGVTEVTVPVCLAQLSDPRFADDLAQMFEETGVEPRRLVCDIRATAVPATNRVAIAAIEKMRGLGVKIAVSDFSAGIAGLTMIRPHPVDLVRLDLEHVRAIGGKERFTQMMSLVLELAATVETPVTLTGVDSMTDLECAITVGDPDIEGLIAGPVLSAGQVAMIFPLGDAAAGIDAKLAG